MWELICHHTYKLGGLAVDLSDHDCHGQAIDTTFVTDGIAPGSGALNFQNTGRVHIPVSPVWQRLGGIRVEVTARLTGPRSLPRTFIRGAAQPGGAPSFIFCVWNRELIASYATTQSTWPSANHERIGSISNPIQYSTDPVYQVPFDPWMQ